MTSIAQHLQHARARLAPVAGDSAPLEARLLAQHAWGMPHEQLLRDVHTTIDDAAAQQLSLVVDRRMQHEPLSQITGSKDFWRDQFTVTADVLTPRADSETLIEALLRQMPERDAPYRVLDLGTGSGCLLLSVLREYPNATGLGIDTSPAALAVAEGNAQRLGLAQRAAFRRGDWCSTLDSTERFAIVVTNPPYIARADIAGLAEDVKGYEPHLALDGGDDGLDCYRTILSTIRRQLEPGACVLAEVGAGQAEAVTALGIAQGLHHTETSHDLAGIARIVGFTNERNES